MKRIFSILLCSIIVLAACDNNSESKEDKAKADSIAKETERKNKVQEAKDKVATDLEKLAPLTEEQIKALMPEMLGDVPLSDYSFSAAMGAPVASGEYKMTDSSSVILTISDCAGSGGAGLYNLQYAGQLEYNNENDIEYTKVIDFNGSKAIEYCRKTIVECSFTYFSGGRYLVLLEGKNIGADDLKKIGRELKVK
ncbi:MAG: hypothetical protein HOP10_03390 [Chitinophagaceae bacterium]|nr:hypothetical protein [Chitinophagaceae bacterium]